MKISGLKKKLSAEKPWALMGWSRREYEERRLWKAMDCSRVEFEQFLRALPAETIKQLKDQAHAEILVEALFGEGSLDEPEKPSGVE